MNYFFAGYLCWVGIGAIYGAISAVARKIDKMALEPPKPRRVDQSLIEASSDAIYDMSRIAAHAGMGAGCGGLFAGLFPVSMIIYRDLYSREQRPI